MKKLTLIAVLLISGALVLNSCKKKEDDVAPAATKSTMLVGTWKITASTVDPGIDVGTGTLITDLFSFMPACEKDNLFIFKSDKSYSMEEGATKCDDTDPQIREKGTWAFDSDQSHLITTDDSGDAEEIEIKSLTSSKFVIASMDTTGGVTRTYTHTMTKQ